MFALPSSTGGALSRTYLHQRHFLIALGVATALHLVFLLLWMFSPSSPVQEIPVRTLNIKLGDDRGSFNLDASIRPAPETTNAKPVEKALQKVLEEKNLPLTAARPDMLLDALNNVVKANQEQEKVVLLPKKQETVAKKAEQKPRPKPEAVEQPEQKKFVREKKYNYTPLAQATPQPKNEAAANQETPATASTPNETPKGAEEGNSTESQAEILKRYEQLISLWIQKFKVYPEQARADGIEGRAVVRIRIDRQGTVRFTSIDSSSGHQILDRAVLEMIDKANPMPPVPDNYKSGQLFEFKIPVSFKL